jgi:hypothetical protein
MQKKWREYSYWIKAENLEMEGLEGQIGLGA